MASSFYKFGIISLGLVILAGGIENDSTASGGKCESDCGGGSLASHVKTSGSVASISPEKSLVYGPGLYTGFTVPARYFFVQLVDQEGNNITETPSGELKVKVSQLSKSTHIWNQILNRKDGTYIVRFKLFQPMEGFVINITYNDVPVAKSPYKINGIQNHELCYCPKPYEDWFQQMGCYESNYSQIDSDLKPFQNVDMEEVLAEAKNRFNIPGAYSFCHYSVMNNRIFKKCYGQYVGFSMFMEETLLSLTRKAQIPDVEFISNLGDWPLENKADHENPLPIFSWCGSKTTKDIVMPTYDLTESSLEMMGRVMLDVLSVQGNSPLPWNNKIDQGFWRGRDSRMERLDLIALGRKNPDLINASLTNFFFFQDKVKEYGPKATHVSFFDFFRYKYQINIDGTVAAYRFPYLLAGDSLVLKQDSDYYEHFYHQLQPMVHYVPFKRDLSDLVDKLKWARQHDEKAKQIAQNARDFVNENLLPPNIFCYYAHLLKEFSQRLVRPVMKLDDMEEVPQPVGKTDCLCDEIPTKNRQSDEL